MQGGVRCVLTAIFQILSRFTNDSCVDMNTSAFQNEMREAEYIIRNMTNSSLILIDELGRGIYVNDCMALGIYSFHLSLLQQQAPMTR